MADNVLRPGLPPEELAEIVEAMRAKRIPRPCEMCDANNWVVGQHLASPVLLNNDLDHVTPNYDLIQTSIVVICSNCGNTKMLSAGTLLGR